MWGWSEHHAERAAAASWTSRRTRTPKPTVTDPELWIEPRRTESAPAEGHRARPDLTGEPSGRGAVGRESNGHRSPARATPAAGGAAVDASAAFGPRSASATRCGRRVVLERAPVIRRG